MESSDSSQTEELRSVFFVSDRTGLTAQNYGRTLLSQFPGQKFKIVILSFVDTVQKATLASARINAASARAGKQSVVFSTIISEEEQKILESSDACIVDLYNTFLGPLETFFGQESAHRQGRSRAIFGDKDYQGRLDAIDYSLSHDDGLRYDQYGEADVILVGVSRCGKTPTSLFLAMNFSMKVSNYPLTEEDFNKQTLPDCLLKHKEKLVALTIKVAPLSRIRRARRPNSEYASFAVCEQEVRIAETMFSKADIPVFDTTDISIEEIASEVVKALGLGMAKTSVLDA
jgi:regulator of PEP synthase PpsR (kinase-PPPase family)